ncbi:MAG: hypothetical protein GY794_13830 [bacterium]|nr:hypothetical protein [bacterium]
MVEGGKEAVGDRVVAGVEFRLQSSGALWVQFFFDSLEFVGVINEE